LQNINNRSKWHNFILSYTKAGLYVSDVGPISRRKQKDISKHRKQTTTTEATQKRYHNAHK